MSFSKKTGYKILLLIIIQAGCSKKETQIEKETPVLEISKDSYEFLFNDINGELTVESNTDWTVSSNQSWCAAQRNGKNVAFTLENNMNPYSRTVELEISTTAGLKEKVYIIQHGNVPTLIIDNNEFFFENKGGEVTVNVRSNVSWVVSSDSPTWCHIEQETGKIKITIDESNQTIPRQAVVLLRGDVTGAGNVIAEDKFVIIFQEGAPFGVDLSEVDVVLEGGQFELNVTSTSVWNYTSNASWITILREQDKLKLDVSANTGIERTGQITITSGSYSSIVHVKQTGLTGSDLDRYVLIKIYENMGGNSWTGTKWDIIKSLSDVASWNGVTISNGRVTAIALNRRGLTGTIPEEVRFLTEMTNFNLGNNTISGEIPFGIGDFSKLLYLVLNGNQLSGSIPQTITKLNLLRTLNLANNNLEGNIPTGLGPLIALTSLQVQNNRLTGSIPQDLKSRANWSSLSGSVCTQQAGYGFTNCP